MTITTAWKRGSGSRRAVDKISELRDENVQLLNRQAAADDYFAILMSDRADVYLSWRYAEQKAARAEDLVALQYNVIRCITERAEAAEQQVGELEEEVLALRAYKTSIEAINHPEHANEATQPIVMPLWEAHGQGRASTDPRRTTWGVLNEQAGVA